MEFLRPDKEIFEKDQKKEITSVNMQQPSVRNLMSPEIAEKVNSDNEGSMVKMEKYVKMMKEENKKLREMVEMLMLET
ncbi:hypothetical protein REPUB_Repub13aG0122200 [Reevesia pubescens]